MRRLRLANTILICLLLFFSCSRQQSQNPVLLHAETIMEAHPDSVLALLKAISSPQDMPEVDRAKYALLMATATDKNELSLLPCDSLLNFALDYYNDNEKEMAVALLYKGRLQAERGDAKGAIQKNLKALDILEAYPKELKLKGLIYSALGVWYRRIKAYDKAIEMQQKALQVGIIAKDTILAFTNISLLYFLKDHLDSAVTIQKEALNLATRSNDSNLITSCLSNLSFFHKYTEEYDSAITYAYLALKKMPIGYKNQSNCYYHLGNIYLTKENYDSAAFYLNKCLPETDIEEKAVTYRTLSYLEEQVGHYENAFRYLEEYVNINDSVTEASQVSEIQHLIYQHQTEIEVQKEQQKAAQWLAILATGFIVVCFSIVLLYQKRLNTKKRFQLLREQALKELQYKLSFVQKTIEENETVIRILHQSQENKDEEIKLREQTIEQLKEEKLKLRIWLLEQSAIYKKVITLSQQEANNKKELQVLKTAELDKLRKVIFEIYADHINSLQTAYPKLTEDDVLYLCLQLTDLSSLTIARCFGYTNTQPINQRKLRLKEKMK